MSRHRPMAKLILSILLVLGLSLSCADDALAQNPRLDRVADGRIGAEAVKGIEISAEQEKISIRWIDTGITFLGDDGLITLLFKARPSAKYLPAGWITAVLLDPEFWGFGDDNFSLFGKPPLRTEYYPSLFGGNGAGQITVRMPERSSEIDGRDRPLTPEEWTAYGATLEEDLYRQIMTRREKGADDIEIRTVQVINPLGYMDPRRQAQIEKFTEVFLKSLYLVRQRLEKEQKKVEVIGACGSNGCFAASRAIPWLNALHMNPVDAMLMFDGRAFEVDVIHLIRVLDQKVAIINTAGDFPAAREFWGLFTFAARGLPPMIASYECSQRLKGWFPGIRVFFAANPNGPFGLAFWITRHITMMEEESTSDVKEFLESNLSRKLGRLSGTDLSSLALRDFGLESYPITVRRDTKWKISARDRENLKARKDQEDDDVGGCDPQDGWWCTTSNKFLPFFSPCPPWLPDCWLPVLGGPPPCDPVLGECGTAEGLGSPPCLPGKDCRDPAREKSAKSLHRPLPDFLRYDVWLLFEPIPDLAGTPSPSLVILISQ